MNIKATTQLKPHQVENLKALKELIAKGGFKLNMETWLLSPETSSEDGGSIDPHEYECGSSGCLVGHAAANNIGGNANAFYKRSACGEVVGSYKYRSYSDTDLCDMGIQLIVERSSINGDRGYIEGGLWQFLFAPQWTPSKKEAIARINMAIEGNYNYISISYKPMMNAFQLNYSAKYSN